VNWSIEYSAEYARILVIFILQTTLAMKSMSHIKGSHIQVVSFASIIAATTLLAAVAMLSVSARAQDAAEKMPEGDATRGEEHFEATCSECHGPAATAPTLRGIINRPIASVESFYGYSESLKALQGKKWTVENINAYLTAPERFAPGNLMYRDYPDAQMRADVIAFLATLPPPRQ
jgi:cytochrome c